MTCCLNYRVKDVIHSEGGGNGRNVGLFFPEFYVATSLIKLSKKNSTGICKSFISKNSTHARTHTHTHNEYISNAGSVSVHI